MEKALEGAPDGCPEFLSPPANPYYHIDNGEQSPYGDQLMVLLESLAACKGKINDLLHMQGGVRTFSFR